MRPPRLIGGPASTRPLEHDAHHSTRSTSINREELAAFLIEVVERPLPPRGALRRHRQSPREEPVMAVMSVTWAGAPAWIPVTRLHPPS